MPLFREDNSHLLVCATNSIHDLDSAFTRPMKASENSGSDFDWRSDWEIDVVCLEGEGTTTVDGLAEPIHAGESIRWPAGTRHRLFTEDSTMVTLMVEHVALGSEKRVRGAWS